MPVDCNKPGSEQERRLCACELATKSMVDALNQFEARLQSYSTQMAGYKHAYEQWQAAKSDWTSRRQAQMDALGTEDLYAGRGACGSNAGCPSGWTWHRNANSRGLCEQVCRRNSDQVTRDLSQWLASNPEPAEPNKAAMVSDYPTAPPRSNIQCCAMVIGDIGGSADISNLNQNCSQQLQTALNQSSGTGEASAPNNNNNNNIATNNSQSSVPNNNLRPGTNQDPASNTTPTGAVAAAAFSCLCCCCCLVVLLAGLLA